MIADSVSAELGMHKNQSFTKLEPGSDPLTLEKKFHTIHTKTFSDTATLVFVHQNSLLDPLNFSQSINKEVLLTKENHSPRSNSGPSSSYDDKTVILPGAVSDKRRSFEPYKPNNDSKPQPTRWPTSKSVLKIKTDLVSDARPTPQFVGSLDQTSGSGSGSKDHVSTRAANLSGAPLDGQATNINSVQTCSSLFTTPPDDQPLSKQSTPLPSQERARLGCPPPSPVAITTEYVCGTERDQTPESNPQHRSASDSKHVGEDGTKKTNETPPPRKRATLVYRSLPPQQNKLPDKQLGSPHGEVGTGHVSSQEELSPNATSSFNSSSYHNNSTSTPAQHKQNPWDLFGSPDEVKIYSALTCGLACGALAAISVPAAPVVAGIAGIAAGGVVGYAIAEQISRDMEKKRSINKTTRL